MLGGGSKYGFCIIIPGGDYRFMPYNYVTCKNVMSRRVVMLVRGVMCDIRHLCQEEAL